MADKQVLVTFLTGAILANGEYEECDKVVLNSIAEDLELDKTAFLKDIDAEIAKQQAMTEDDLGEHISDMAEGLSEDAAFEIFNFCVQAVYADGVFSKEEVDLLVCFAEILEVDISEAIILMLSYNSNFVADDGERV